MSILLKMSKSTASVKSSVASQVHFYGNREDNYKLTMEPQDIQNSQSNLDKVEQSQRLHNS